jgi:hypothetical protein
MLDLDLQFSSMLPFVASPLASSTTVPAAKHSCGACAEAACAQQPASWIDLAGTISTGGPLSVASSPQRCLV